MNTIVKGLIWMVFVILVGGNIFLFVSGIAISDEIRKYEIDTKQLSQNNEELSKKIFEIESLKQTASKAAELDYRQSQTLVIDRNIRYAFKQ